jgi:branched-chain amino acid transport system ATP-binding protein
MKLSPKVSDRPVILSGADLTKFFGGLAALNGVDFQLHENEILGIIGPNGAGKTTLFNLIAGVYKPDGGIIRFRDEVINGLRPHQICRKGIARTFQITKPFLKVSTLENIMVGAYFGLYGKRHLKQCKVKAEEILSYVGLEDKARVMASQLTLVERKAVELGRALSTDPSILLLDEVVAGLNPTETLKMMELIKDIRDRGITILMIEHVMKAVMGISNRLVVLHYGQRIAEGSAEEISANQDVIEAYLGGIGYANST